MKEVLNVTPKKKRKLGRDVLLKDLYGLALSPKSLQQFPMEGAIMVAEENYFENGCPMFFPESPAMLEMLWRAKMNLELEDLDMDAIPSTFSVAWPRCEIAGSRLQGCMVSIMTASQHSKLVQRVSDRYLENPPNQYIDPKIYSDGDYRIFISYFEERSTTLGQPVYHCCIPGKFVAKVLKDEAEFHDFMGNGKWFKTGTYVASLDENEQHQQYVMAKLVLALLVYMNACPEQVHDGLPDGRKQREFSSANSSVTGKILGVPPGLGGTHASPGAHWRSWHFRSYPRRKDGSRRKGVVRVKGTVVGANIDPHTVEDEALRPRIKTCA